MITLYNILNDIGNCVLFLKQIFKTAFTKSISINLIAEQIWKVFTQSFSTTAMAGFFVGAILTLQFISQLKMFGALGYLGGLSTSASIREVGPLLIAFMLSGKVGAYTSAELGTMRVSEQIDAIRCLGADPIQEIIVPRFIGIVISSFFLLFFGLVLSVLGGTLLGGLFSDISWEEYLRHIPNLVTSASIYSGLFKSFCFSLVLASVCTYKGYHTSGGAKGVGKAVVSTSVSSMVAIVLFDWLSSLISNSIIKVMGG